MIKEEALTTATKFKFDSESSVEWIEEEDFIDYSQDAQESANVNSQLDSNHLLCIVKKNKNLLEPSEIACEYQKKVMPVKVTPTTNKRSSQESEVASLKKPSEEEYYHFNLPTILNKCMPRKNSEIYHDEFISYNLMTMNYNDFTSSIKSRILVTKKNQYQSENNLTFCLALAQSINSEDNCSKKTSKSLLAESLLADSLGLEKSSSKYALVLSATA
jgi:hypothetical protein